MALLDPYRPPAADLGTSPDPQGLLPASRARRLVAALVDFVFLACFQIILSGALLGVAVVDIRPGPWTLAEVQLVSAFAAAVVQGHFLMRHSATLGKRLLGLVVRSANGAPASLRQLLLLRPLVEVVVCLLGAADTAFEPGQAGTFPLTILDAWAVFLLLLDTLWIFRRDRRCLHDHIAGTVVLSARPARG